MQSIANDVKVIIQRYEQFPSFFLLKDRKGWTALQYARDLEKRLECMTPIVKLLEAAPKQSCCEKLIGGQLSWKIGHAQSDGERASIEHRQDATELLFLQNAELKRQNVCLKASMFVISGVALLSLVLQIKRQK